MTDSDSGDSVPGGKQRESKSGPADAEGSVIGPAVDSMPPDSPQGASGSSEPGGENRPSGSGKPSRGSGSGRPSTHGSFFNDDFTSDESLKLTRVDGSQSPLTHPTSRESQRSRQPGIALGTVIDQRFVLEKLLGRGGMNVVYRARDRVKEQARDPNPHVAIKILGAEFSKNPEAWITLQRETKKAQRLAHPRIAAVHDFQIDRDTRLPFAQMEELHGEPLDRFMRRARGGLEDLREAARIVEDIAEGLAYAHEQGIVHCDLKPSNIFLTEDNEIKILDFGIARLMPGAGDDDFDAGRMSALTPAYAASEMFGRLPPDPADDVYALGVIAYELFCGHHPYESVLSSREPVLAARERGLKPQRPAGFNRRQWQVVAASLAFDREDRPRDGAEFLRRFSRRSPLPLLLSGVSLVLALALAWSIWLRAPEPLPDVPFSALSETAQARFTSSMQEGWTAFRLEDYNGALHFFSSAHDLHPRNPEAVEGLDAIVEVVLQQPDARDAAEAQAQLEQVFVLLSYEALSGRRDLLSLRDDLQEQLGRR